MDRKTLEYMEERTKRARAIVNTIESLKKKQKDIEERSGRLVFTDKYGNYSATIESGKLTDGLIHSIKQSVVKEIDIAINKLEAELLEL